MSFKNKTNFTMKGRRLKEKMKSSKKLGFINSCTRLKEEHIDEIRHALRTKRHDIVERLSNRFGVDPYAIKSKMGELEILESLRRLSHKISEKIKRED